MDKQAAGRWVNMEYWQRKVRRASITFFVVGLACGAALVLLILFLLTR